MMNAEQKQAARNLIDDFKGAGNEFDEAAVANHMAALLQELVDAPEPEPVASVPGVVKLTPGWHMVGIVSDGAHEPIGELVLSGGLIRYTTFVADWVEQFGKADCAVKLYASDPPAPSVPELAAEVVNCGGELKTIWVGGKQYPVGTKFYTSPPAEAPAMPKLKFVAEFDDGEPVEIEVFGTQRNLNRLAARIEYYENLDRPAEAPADVARDTELLDWLTAKCVTLECNKYARIITITVDSEIALDQRHQVDLRGAIKTAIEREKLRAAMSEKGGA